MKVTRKFNDDGMLLDAIMKSIMRKGVEELIDATIFDLKNEGILEELKMEMKQVNFNVESAAFYIRVSTNNKSQDDSYEEQYEMLEREMKRRGFILYKVYKE